MAELSSGPRGRLRTFKTFLEMIDPAAHRETTSVTSFSEHMKLTSRLRRSTQGGALTCTRCCVQGVCSRVPRRLCTQRFPSNDKVTAKIAHLGDAPFRRRGVRCGCYVSRGGANALRYAPLECRERVNSMQVGMALLQKATWEKRARTLALWLLALLVAASIGVFLAAKPAHADTFTVNSTSDARDINIGDSRCDTSSTNGRQCTLRAAIQESNANNNDALRSWISSASTSSLAPPL
jgi:hypothetical protein